MRLEVTIEAVAVTASSTIATVTWREAYNDAGVTRVYIERDREEWRVVDGAWRIRRTDVLDTSHTDDSLTPRSVPHVLLARNGTEAGIRVDERLTPCTSGLTGVRTVGWLSWALLMKPPGKNPGIG